MAGDWIKMRTNLDTDPRVIELAMLLGVPELHVVGMLWKVWAWADGHTLDGNALRVTHVTLDRFTAVTGFADALRKVGWLEGRDGALSFPRFAEHNGQTAKNRAETNKRVVNHRNAKRVTDVTQKPLPEKRREEKRRSNTKSKPKSYSESFDRWWQLYPRRVGKDAAWSAYQKAVDRIVANEDVEQAVAESLLYDWTSDRVEAITAFEIQYQPHPATWLNAGRYQDEIVTASKVADLTDMENYRP